jgi:hypothetical protein
MPGLLLEYGLNGHLIEIKVQSVTSNVVFNAFFTLLTWNKNCMIVKEPI